MKAAFLLIFALTGTLVAEQEGDRILGTWNTPNGESKVEIVKCGNAYCGSIKSVNRALNGEHGADAPAGRPSPVGKQILKGFRYSGSDTWSGGTLYAPERGKDVTPKLVLTGVDSLDIKITVGVIRKTVTWAREK